MAKRTLDLVLSVTGLIILSPVMLIVALAILITMGWPIIYRAERAGRYDKPFKIAKFRSMRPAGPGETTHHPGNDDPRLTPVGRFIRGFKLDEFPQLVNVLVGDMSIVRPRPEIIEYAALYTEEQQVILSVRPGITDYASLEFAHFGAILPKLDPDAMYFEKVWEAKMELRMRYVRERTFWTDIKIIFRTFGAVFPPRRRRH